MPHNIIVCTNFRPFSGQPSCAYRGSNALADYLEAEIKVRGLDAIVCRSVCLGHCPKGPNVRLAGKEIIHEADEKKLDSMLRSLDRQS